MNYIFFGILGSGKGTQAELVSKKFRLSIVSTGNLFRKNIKNKTKLGKLIEKTIANGHLVDDEITIEVLKKELKRINTKKGIILDGYPRTLHQAKILEDILKIDAVFNIKLRESEVLDRIAKRRTCKCGAIYNLKYNPPKKSGICDKCRKHLFIRSDSKESVVKNRIRVYKSKTEKLINFYKKKNILINIDGNLSIKDVFKQISQEINKLNDKNKK